MTKNPTKVLYRSGFLIRVSTWENDGDHPNTKEMHVSTGYRHVVDAIVEFAWLHRSDSHGNVNQEDAADISGVEDAYAEFNANNPYVVEYVAREMSGESPASMETEEIVDYLHELAEQLGIGGSEDFFTRVVDKVEVLFFHNDVVAEIITPHV